MKLPQVIEINGIRVLTTEQLARNYGTQPKILQYNFLMMLGSKEFVKTI